MNIAQPVERGARQFPERPALLFEGESLSYGQLDAQSSRAANSFAGFGIGPGDRVAIWLPNSAPFVIAYLGAHKLGAIAVTINTALQADEIRYILNDSGAALLITTAALYAGLADAELPHIRHVVLSEGEVEGSGSLAELLREASPQRSGLEMAADDPAVLLYTSGTTGFPKGALLSHQNVVIATQTAAVTFGLQPEDRVLLCLSAFHNFAQIAALTPCFEAGATLILHRQFALETVLRSIEKEEATFFYGVPTLYLLLLEQARPEQLRSIRRFISAGAPLPVSLQHKWLEKYGRAIQEGYGLTEVCLATFNHDPISSAGSVGRPLAGVQIRIVDELGDAVAPGELGEVIVNSPSVLRSYWNRPEESAAVLRDGWFHTGDLGRLDEDGCLYIVDRIKDMVNVGGVKVYPAEVESILYQHPAVTEAAVYGVAEPLLGEQVQASVVLKAGAAVTAQELIAFCRQRMAEFKTPGQIEFVDQLPKNRSGKILKRLLREKALRSEQPQPEPSANASATEAAQADAEWRTLARWMALWLSDHLQIQSGEIDWERPFAEYGMTSVMAVNFAQALGEWLGRPFPAILLWNFPTIADLARHARADSTPAQREETNHRPTFFADPDALLPRESLHKQWDRCHSLAQQQDDIALIGIGCRFPGGADTPEKFWRILHDGVDTAREIPPSRWDVERFYDPNPNAPGKMYVRSGNFLDNVDQFDAAFFGIAPLEAASLDPQQRLLLEVCWEALEHADLAADRLRGSRSGVFVGAFWDDYSAGHLYAADPQQIDGYRLLSNLRGMMAGRLAYSLGFHGPAMQLDTACSSSLLAVHLACRSLHSQECDLALAGGVSLILAPEQIIGLCKLRAVSPSGRCKTFAAEADGFGVGEGAGIVVLKRYADAVRDGDRIVAVIRGSAVNHDGPSNGLTAPNGQAQEALLRQALENAAVRPQEIHYVETHGTGTALGDPIEAQALANVLGKERQHPLFLGSVKTNIGHLSAAAGIASLIKVALALDEGQIPPSLHFTTPNPLIPWSTAPLAVPVEPISWPLSANGATGSSVGPRLAGVSSFGLTGTNVHLIVAEAPRPRPASTGAGTAPTSALHERPYHLLPLSARSTQALSAQIERYERWLAAKPTPDLADICYTAATGRVHWGERLGIVAPDLTTARARLGQARRTSGAPGVRRGAKGDDAPRIAFLFPGQGPQYVEMGRQLYETQPIFRRTLDVCDEILRAHLDPPLLTLLYGPDKSRADELLNQATYAQPALFAVEYALALLWRAWGIEPEALIGHSMGEYAAACLAGVFSLEDGLRFIAERGRLMQCEAPKGLMMAVLGSVDEVQRILQPYRQEVAVAAINTPNSLTIAGAPAVIRSAGEELQRAGIETRPLKIHVASHSPLMEPILAQFGAVAQSISYRRPNIKIISNLTGQVADEELTTPDYWRRHLRESVRFAQGMATIGQLGIDTYMEVGPKRTLLGLGQQCLPANDASLWLPSIHPKTEDWAQMLDSLSALYTRGAAVDWQGFDQGYKRQKVSAPLYPFQRQRYWIEMTKSPSLGHPSVAQKPAFEQTPSSGRHPLLGRQLHSVLTARSQELLFENRLDLASLRYLADHTLFDQIIAPGAVYLEMIAAAGEQIWPQKGLTIEECSFQQGLFLPYPELTPGTTAQVLFTPAGPGYEWQIYSQTDTPPSTVDWTLHASGRVRVTHSPLLLPRVDLADVRARCPETVDLAGYYDRLREQGIAYGPAFQTLTQLFVGDGEALGCVELPASLSASVGAYRLHPVVLDGCLRVAAALLPADESDPYLPFSVERMQLSDGAPTRVWSYVKRRADADAAPGSRQVDVTLLDEEGRVLVLLTNFSLRRASRQSFAAQRRRLDWLYEIVWKPASYPVQPSYAVTTQPPHPTPPQSGEGTVTTPPPDWGRLGGGEQSPFAQNPGRWLILADRTGRGDGLAAQLEAQGEQCAAIYRDDLPADASAVDFFRGLLQGYGQGSPANLRGVVYLWGLDTLDLPAAQAPDAALQTSLDALYLVQALLQTEQRPRLWLVTQEAIGEGVATVQAPQAPLWGLGRTIHWEHPELRCACVDVAGEISHPAFFREIWFAGRVGGSAPQENQILLRSEGRLVARLARHPAPMGRPLGLDGNGSYLVTGGLGGLGLQTAKWLVAQGARHLILASRRGDAPPEALPTLHELESAGAQILVVQADVASEADVRRLLEVSKSIAPLRGIVHAAGVIDDGILLQQTKERFERVMASKVAGSWHLHTLTCQIPLDFFITFSSVSALLGNPGQANYAAANAFMDALAQQRQREGKPALSIQWGGWSDVGLAATLVKQTEAAGLGSISPAQGIDFLNLFLAERSPQVGVLPVEWQKYARRLPDRAAFPLFTELIEPPKEQNPASALREQIVAASADESLLLVKSFVHEQIVTLLGTKPSDQESLLHLGLDSLLSIQLANRLGAGLGLSLPATLAFQYETVGQLTQFLLESLTHTGAIRATSAATVAGPSEAMGAQADSSGQPLDSEWFPQLYNQQECYIWHEEAANKACLHVQQSIRIHSAIDLSALAGALQALVDRHEALRTIFVRRDGELLQRIPPARTVDFAAVNLENQSWQSAAHVILLAAQQPFNLAEGPLLRGRLFSRGAEDHLLLLVVHHIAADATALSIIVNELWSLYSARRTGNAPSLPPVKASWTDFVRWQNRLLVGSEGERLWRYWKQQLAGDLPKLNLPTDYLQPQTDSHHGRPYAFEIDAALTGQLRQLAQQERCTLFMVLMAAFQVLLHLYTEQDDILVAAHVANRSEDRFEETVGYLADTVAIRTQIPSHATFRTLLHQAQSTILAAIDHQGFPLRLLAERLGAQDHPTRPSICQVWFTLLPLRLFQESGALFQSGRGSIQAAGLTLEAPDLIPAWLGAWYDLEMILTEGESVVFGTLVYKTDLFAEATIGRMLADFSDLLAMIAAEPTRLIASLSPFHTNSTFDPRLYRKVDILDF